MSFTASTGQQAATPVRTTVESSVVSSGILINGASFSTAQIVNSDETLVTSSPSGTLSGDCTALILASHNNVNFGIVRTLTNAEITHASGWAGVIKVGQGNYLRFQFIPGTTTGAGNGVTLRFRN